MAGNSCPAAQVPPAPAPRPKPAASHPWRVWVHPDASKDAGRFIPSRDRMGLSTR